MKRMTTVLGEMINGPGIFAAPGAYDPLSARLAEWIGFRALDLPGSALGYATAIMEPNLSLENVVQATRSITAAVNIPLVVDAGAGFGEPAHVFHMVRELEHVGAAGIHIEDQIYPKRFHYHRGVEHTIPAEMMVDKIRCALEARRDPDFVIVARTDNFRTTGLADGVRRSNLYLEAGAHMIMPAGLKTAEEIRQLPKEVHGPLNFPQPFRADGGPPLLSLRELEALGGYKLINYPTAALLASYRAMRDMLRHLMETGEMGMEREVYTCVVKELQDTIGLPEYYRIEKETTEKT